MSKLYSSPCEPSDRPPGFGLRQSSGAFENRTEIESGRGLPQSRTPPRQRMLLEAPGSARNLLLHSLIAMFVLALAGCTLAPKYHRPTAAYSSTWPQVPGHAASPTGAAAVP